MPEMIDPDVPFYVYADPCETCGQACAGPICDRCAIEAQLFQIAEKNCPDLYERVLRSKTVREASEAFRQHQQTCPNCRRNVRQMPAPRERAA